MKLVAPLIATALLAAACIPGGPSDTIEASSSTGSVLGPADAALMTCMTSAGLGDADRIAVAAFLNGQSGGVGSPELAERAGGVLATCVTDNGLKIGTALIDANNVEEDSDRECVLFTSALSSSAVFANVLLNTPDTAGEIASLYRSDCDLAVSNVVELYPIGVTPGIGTLGADETEQAAPTTTAVPTTEAPTTTAAPTTVAPTTAPAPVASEVATSDPAVFLGATMLPSPIVLPDGAVILEVDHTVSLDRGPFTFQGDPSAQVRRWSIRGLILGDADQALAAFDSSFWGIAQIDAGISVDGDSSSAFSEFASPGARADVNGFSVVEASIRTSNSTGSDLSAFEIDLRVDTGQAETALSGPIVDAATADGFTSVLPAGGFLSEVTYRFDSPWINSIVFGSLGQNSDLEDPTRLMVSLKAFYPEGQTDVSQAVLDNQNNGYELIGTVTDDSLTVGRDIVDRIAYSTFGGSSSLDPYQIVTSQHRSDVGPAPTADALAAALGL